MADYKVSNDNIASFIEDEITEHPGSTIERKELYDAYKEYCEINGYNAVAVRRFNTNFQSHLPRVERRDQPRPAHWIGVYLS